MRVKLKTLMAGPAGVAQAGQTITVTDDEGKQLLDGGFAELVSVSADEDSIATDAVDESLAGDEALAPEDVVDPSDEREPTDVDAAGDDDTTDPTDATTTDAADASHPTSKKTRSRKRSKE